MERIEEQSLAADASLIEQARQGDTRAYSALVERYQEVAFRTAFIVVRDAGEAEDATQEAFIKAFYALPRFRPGAAFGPWLLEIVANQARNQRRAGGRRGALALRASAAAQGASGGAAPSPEAGALLEERRQALLGAVSSLRDEDRLVVAYRYFFELSESEMAAALGCARGTVKSKLSRALVRLRQKLVERDRLEAERG